MPQTRANEHDPDDSADSIILFTIRQETRTSRTAPWVILPDHAHLRTHQMRRWNGHFPIILNDGARMPAQGYGVQIGRPVVRLDSRFSAATRLWASPSAVG